MKLIKIKISNFRPYAGRIEIDLSTDPSKNFTIIQGNNGTGKSNLMSAILWCMYGEPYGKSEQSSRPMWNEYMAESLKEGESITVSVSTIWGENEPKCEIERINTFTKEKGRFFKSGEKFIINEFSKEKGTMKLDYPGYVDKKIIPKDHLNKLVL